MLSPRSEVEAVRSRRDQIDGLRCPKSGVKLAQETHDITMTVAMSIVQRKESPAITPVNPCTFFNQKFTDRNMPFGGGDMKRGPSIIVTEIDKCTILV